MYWLTSICPLRISVLVSVRVKSRQERFPTYTDYKRMGFPAISWRWNCYSCSCRLNPLLGGRCTMLMAFLQDFVHPPSMASSFLFILPPVHQHAHHQKEMPIICRCLEFMGAMFCVGPPERGGGRLPYPKSARCPPPHVCPLKTLILPLPECYPKSIMVSIWLTCN